MGNSSTTNKSAVSVTVQGKKYAGDRHTDASTEYGPLPTLLSSNRHVARQRELAKSWYDENNKFNDAMGFNLAPGTAPAALKARLQVSDNRLASRGDSSVSLSSKAKRPGSSWMK